jgi:hypothetical protein
VRWIAPAFAGAGFRLRLAMTGLEDRFLHTLLRWNDKMKDAARADRQLSQLPCVVGFAELGLCRGPQPDSPS